MNLPPGTVALDTMVLVYFLEKHPEYFPVVRRTMKRIEEGELQGLASALVLTEALVPLHRAERHRQAREVAQLLVSFPNLTIVPATPDICFEASRLRAVYGLRTPDALHFATAQIEGAQVFLTNDRRLDRLSDSEVKVRVLAP